MTTPDDRTPPGPADGAPDRPHGDPLLAASQGATEGTEGSRHGLEPAAEDGEA